MFLVQLAERRFPQPRRPEPLPLPPELRSAPGDEKLDHDREERRLFYVGMTRARDRLVLTRAPDYGGRREHKPSRFVVECLDLPPEPKRAAAASPLESIARYAPAAEIAPPELATAGRALGDDQPLTVSHGQIDDFLTCPLKYRFAHVAQVPLQSNPAVMYGIAMHHAIRIYHQHRMKGLPITAEDVIAAFEGAWSSEGFYSREHEEQRLDQGRRAIRRFVEREQAARTVPLAVEKEFKFRLGATTVVGRWDRIDETREGVVLVDYKTSEVADSQKADERALKSLKEEQLGLYALAYSEMYGVTPARVELEFVEAGIHGRAAVTPKHLARARARVEEAAAGIRSGNFPPDPDQRKCGYCPYARICIHSAARGGE